MKDAGRITRLSPRAALPNAEILIECEGFAAAADPRDCAVTFDGTSARLVGFSLRRILALVPEDVAGAKVAVKVRNGASESAAAECSIATLLGEDLHPVANPAINPITDEVFVTRSGGRGQELPATLFHVSVEDKILHEYTGTILNPTGLAFDREGRLYASNRAEGTVHRFDEFGEPEIFARDLGVATGIAFDKRGNLFVGDRTGTIWRVNPVGEAIEWAQHEPSVAAYHLAFGADDALYVSAPTVSSHDSITRFDANARGETFFRGLGRPQGLAFDTDGNLYVVASHKARRGVWRISPDGMNIEFIVAGMNLVGICFNARGNLIVATNDALYSLPLGIAGALLN